MVTMRPHRRSVIAGATKPDQVRANVAAGGWKLTADEVADPHALGIRCFVNGEKRQDSNTSHLVFNVWDQIEHLSQAMTLEPGDLIFTGTPGGIGAAPPIARPGNFSAASWPASVSI